MTTVNEGFTNFNPYPVAAAGYLFGSYISIALYGIHTAQVYQYYGRHSDSWRTRLLVAWIWTLSSIQTAITLSASWKYFVDGIHNPGIWGEFWWPLSVQDGLIPVMGFTAQLFFGHRAWMLTGKKRWILWTLRVGSFITLLAGFGLAITARIWANKPYTTADDFNSRTIGVPSQVVAILWMGLSAVIDGSITLILLIRFTRARSSSYPTTRALVRRMIALTLETVLLTHLTAAVMCIIFISSPAAHRTQSDALWVLIEPVTELYALSVVFTINSRPDHSPPASAAASPDSSATSAPSEKAPEARPFPTTDSALDRYVEGYQGSHPFGVRVGDIEAGQFRSINSAMAGLTPSVSAPSAGRRSMIVTTPPVDTGMPLPMLGYVAWGSPTAEEGGMSPGEEDKRLE